MEGGGGGMGKVREGMGEVGKKGRRERMKGKERCGRGRGEGTGEGGKGRG